MSLITMHAGYVSATLANECTHPATSSGTSYSFHRSSFASRTESALEPSSCSTRGRHAFDCTNLGNGSDASVDSACAAAAPSVCIAASGVGGDCERYRSHICFACAPCAAGGCFCSSAESTSSSRAVAASGISLCSQRPKTEIDAG